MITAQMVKELRETTGCGMMDCKKALSETDGNMEKAMDYLREKGLAAAEKKAGRIAAEGIVSDFVVGNVGVIIEVNSETDFVAKNDDFQAFVKGLAEVVATKNPATVEDLLKLTYVGSDMLVEEVLREKILTIGENMTIRRFCRYEGPVATYIHAGGRIGVIVQAENALDGDAYDAARDAAMQVAAINPRYLDKSEVPDEDIEKEKEILLGQIRNDPKTASKPENILVKMVEGKISKFYNINCLNQQEFVKDPDTTVEKYLATKNVKLVKYQRFEKGEGLAKKEDNFAEEVANMSK
jgi:elongation factor Ts